MTLPQDPNKINWEERRSPDGNVEKYFSERKREIDPETGCRIVKIFSGELHVSTKPKEMISTILGSCISACIRDPIAKVGGMNHFLLPGDEDMLSASSESARYGLFAMESLINGILKAGGRKERLEIKVFGGGNVIKSSAKIGSKNAAFVRNFLKNEGYKIAAEDLEGDLPRRIHYFPDTGKVMMRKLQRKEDMVVADIESKYLQSIKAKPVEGDIDLF
jgi:chemotaxis protein CheD